MEGKGECGRGRGRGVCGKRGGVWKGEGRVKRGEYWKERNDLLPASQHPLL